MRPPKAWGQPGPKPACVHAHHLPPGPMRARAPSRTHRGTRRLLRCHPGERPFAATHATVLFALRPSAAKVRMALPRLLGRGALAGLGGGLGVTAAPGWAWRTRAAPQAAARNHPQLQPLPVPQGPRDERGPWLARPHARAPDEAGARGPAGQDGGPGRGGSCAPALRWMSAAGVGPRPRATAPEGGAAPKARGAGGPAGCSAGCPSERAARSAACHVVMPCPPSAPRGPYA